MKLIDVYPADAPDSDAGRAAGVQARRLSAARARRGRSAARFRDGYEKPEPFVPDEPTTIAFELQDVFHTLKPGHRMMVQVQSTWFPLIDRNPQTFVPNIYKAKESTR